MKVITLPINLKNLGLKSPTSSITTKRIVAEFATLVLTLVLLFVFFGLLTLMMDLPSQPVGLVFGSLTTLLGGKPNRRKSPTPNFKIIADMGVGEKMPNRKQLQDENEDHMWTKYPVYMLNKIMGVQA